MDKEIVKPTGNRPQMYKRTSQSVWVAIPKTSDRCISLFMQVGTWFVIRTEQGDLIQNVRAS